MNKLVIAFLGAVTVFAVGFVLVELHAPLTPSDAHDGRDARDSRPPGTPWVPPPLPPPSASHPSGFGGPPVAGASSSTRPERPPALPPVPSSLPGTPDPGDVVIDGKTRREWHSYYQERQRKAAIEILHYQTVVDRAIAGEEPDPR
ncbi:MAG TPA: hypothetical protein VGL86_11300, partial [Polyangia bacterium]